MKFCERKRISEVSAKKCLLQEVNILKRLNGHANVIQLFEVIETAVHVVLVMEFATGGDLLRYVKQRTRLGESNAQDLFRQLVDGIGYIHCRGIVHRDLKLENLLLDAFGCLKIADFGVAAIMQPGRLLQEHCGTPSYMAPEILSDTGGYVGPPVDLWSIGVVLYAMLCGRVPFKDEPLPDLKRCILRGRFHMPSHFSESAASLVRALLVVDPRRRFGVVEAREHPWLEGTQNRAEAIYRSTAPAALMASRRSLSPQTVAPAAAEPPSSLGSASLRSSLPSDGDAFRRGCVATPMPDADATDLVAADGCASITPAAQQAARDAVTEPIIIEADEVEKFLQRVTGFGFPSAFVEESLREGRTNHATATFRLLVQHAIRHRATASGAAAASLAPKAPD